MHFHQAIARASSHRALLSSFTPTSGRRCLAYASQNVLIKCASSSSTPRLFSSSSARFEKPVTQRTASGTRDRTAVGVFTPKAAALFVATGVGLFFYFKNEKEKQVAAKAREFESRTVGRAHVGGPFTLMTHDGRPFTEKDLLGKWTLLYFGFTNCPDICPAELDKMTTVVNELEKLNIPTHPLFITVDPARDPPEQLARYLQDFHPRFTALTGSFDAIKATCKAYRVYFSTPPGAKPTDDYLVDHSIFVYLMDPEGQFVEAFGQSTTVEEVVSRAAREVKAWEAEKGR